MTEADGKAGAVRRMVREFILKEFLPGTSPDELADDTPLITGGILDSLATVKLVAALEAQFRVEIKAHEASASYMDSVAAITALVSAKLGA